MATQTSTWKTPIPTVNAMRRELQRTESRTRAEAERAQREGDLMAEYRATAVLAIVAHFLHQTARTVDDSLRPQLVYYSANARLDVLAKQVNASLAAAKPN